MSSIVTWFITIANQTINQQFGKTMALHGIPMCGLSIVKGHWKNHQVLPCYGPSTATISKNYFFGDFGVFYKIKGVILAR
jgi:hypothetical protein